ncbi:hypothetical protein AB6805_12950 [Chitinophaga sp. RCC_12]|uniref:hypothetical protein n=1 Tax=Chitinophaga sp. RCC_12 TaxID=3239226 RepID=UPI003525852D
MTNRFSAALAALLLTTSTLMAQRNKPIDAIKADDIKKDLYYLADDHFTAMEPSFQLER